MTNGKSASIKPAGFDVLSAVTCADELRPMGNAFVGSTFLASIVPNFRMGITMRFRRLMSKEPAKTPKKFPENLDFL
jgi:hypothetical protein